jgi:phosphate transport system protein
MSKQLPFKPNLPRRATDPAYAQVLRPMSKHLQRDMDNIHRDLLSLSALVEEMIDKATLSLSTGRQELADEVIRSDDAVDQREVKIEEECLKMLALHQPVAIDLRRVATVLKVNNDLERIADLAVNIAERSRNMDEYPDFPIPETLAHMVAMATQMVRSSLDAFVNLDAQAARRIMYMDDDVDRHNREIIAELQTLMQERPDLVPPGLHCFSISRHIERIADHASNIAEDVIYLVEGDIIRHRHSTNSPPLRKA